MFAGCSHGRSVSGALSGILAPETLESHTLIVHRDKNLNASRHHSLQTNLISRSETSAETPPHAAFGTSLPHRANLSTWPIPPAIVGGFLSPRCHMYREVSVRYMSRRFPTMSESMVPVSCAPTSMPHDRSSTRKDDRALVVLLNRPRITSLRPAPTSGTPHRENRMASTDMNLPELSTRTHRGRVSEHFVSTRSKSAGFPIPRDHEDNTKHLREDILEEPVGTEKPPPCRLSRHAHRREKSGPTSRGQEPFRS